MQPAPRFGFVVEYVSNIDAATRFYTEVLGLEVQRSHPTFVQFESFAIATDEPSGPEGGPEIYWLVDDAEAAYRALSGKAEISTPLTQKPFGKVFAVRDPDGRPRFLLEFSKNRPSKPVS